LPLLGNGSVKFCIDKELTTKDKRVIGSGVIYAALATSSTKNVVKGN
jgi:hypothetical protein